MVGFVNGVYYFERLRVGNATPIFVAEDEAFALTLGLESARDSRTKYNARSGANRLHYESGMRIRAYQAEGRIMYISKMQISGYRKFERRVSIDFFHTDKSDISNTTMLVGANNSGKTSIVELCEAVFGYRNDMRKIPFTIQDFNIQDFEDKWLAKSASEICQFLQEDSQESQDTTSIVNKLKDLFDRKQDNIIPHIEILIDIDFAEDEDIRSIADYLFFYDEKPKSVHFRYVVSSEIERRKNDKEKERRLLDSASYINAAYKKFDEIIKSEQSEQSEQIRFETIIKEQLRRLFGENMSVLVTYCDDKYENDQEINERDFKNLFHCLFIKARRDLDDTKEDNTHTLSSRLFHLVMDDNSWTSSVAPIQQDLMRLLEGGEYGRALGSAAKQQFQQAISDIMDTNGNSEETIGLTSRVEEGSVRKLLESSVAAVYSSNKDYHFSEYSQGLGYSNLTLMLIEFQQFIKDCKEGRKEETKKIDFLIIEEPESHMHPQMQSTFIKHIFETLKEESYITCMITSHAEQMVCEVPLKQIRVLRQKGCYSSIINPCRDLSENKNKYVDFINDEGSISEKEQERRDITYMYSLNFANIVFADKAILFEGDTERMYIQALLREPAKTAFSDDRLRKALKGLRKQYVAFIQVGGAYASAYIPLLDVLNIPSLIITDTDYKKAKGEEDINSSDDLINGGIAISTTNETLEKVWSHNQQNHELSEQMHSYYNGEEIVITIREFDNITVVTQSKLDGFGKTLEDALLYKLKGDVNVENIFDVADREKWKMMRKKKNILFPIPSKQEIAIHDIVKSIANNRKKTDFMYSLILNNQVKESLPDYIKEGLIWLAAKN